MKSKAYEKYLFYLIFSLIITTIGAFIGTQIDISGDLPIMFYIVPLVIIIMFYFSDGALKKLLFLIFCFGEGLALSTIVIYYTPISLFICLLATTIIFIVFAIIGRVTKVPSWVGSFLFISLIGIIIYSVIGLMLDLPSISIIIIVIFMGYIVYDMSVFNSAVKNNPNIDNDEILNHVMEMYLNILNIFIELLTLLKD